MIKSASVPKKKVDKIPARSSTEEEFKRDTTICPVHRKQYEYICKTCNKKLCGDCVFEQLTKKSVEHEGHKIEKIENPVQEAKNELKSELRDAKDILDRYNSIDKRIISIEKVLDSKQSEIKVEMHPIYDSLIKKTELGYSSLEANSLQSAQILKNQVLDIQMILPDITALLTSDDTALLGSAQKMLENINSLLKPPLDVVPKQRLDTTSCLNVPFQSHFYKVADFSKLLSSSVEFIYLPDFEMYGAKWRIKLFPKGNSKGKDSHVSIFIEVLDGFKDTYSCEYQVIFIHPQGRNYERKFTSPFTNMDSWGWNRFYPLKKIIEEGFLDEDDTLQIMVNIRPSNYIILGKIYENIYNKKYLEYKKLKQEVTEKGLGTTTTEEEIPQQPTIPSRLIP